MAKYLTFNKKFLIIGLAAGLAILAAGWFIFFGPKTPIKIGVLYDISGPDSILADEVLNWAKEKINQEGGINGRRVELEYKDTYNQDLNKLTRDLLNDRRVKIVIGPQSSAEVYEIAQEFIKYKKILISPSATAGDIHRIFSKKKFFWRTCQGDVAQIRAILYLLKEKGVRNISLVYENSPYGKTFDDWIGFFAIEMKINLLSINEFEAGQDVSQAVSNALEGNPEYIIAVAFSEDAVKIKKEIDKSKSKTKLFLTDAAETQYVVDNIGVGAELMSPAADPNSGFNEEYKKAFGYYPWDYSVYTYDAFLLAVYGHARHEYARNHFKFEKFEDSFAKVIYGAGDKIQWDQSKEAIKQILAGKLPNIVGASGPLDFDKEFGVDPLHTFYAYNRVEKRDEVTDFWTISVVNSDESLGYGELEENLSAAQTKASQEQLQKFAQKESEENLPAKKDLWAVIISTSAGWTNYRHQADALRVYNLLRKNGVDDKKIILLTVDDVPWIRENPLLGDIHYVPRGENLRLDAQPDYKAEKVTADNFKKILLGEKSDEIPVVLESDLSSNVLIYIVDHGAPGFVPFQYGNPLFDNNLAEIVDKMYNESRFRKLFIIGEFCFGESMGLEIKTPNVLYLTSSAKTESSFGAAYDSEIRQWLSDDFTMHLAAKLTEEPDIGISNLYTYIYSKVIGSHVRLLNYENFGNLAIPVREFITP